MSKLGILVLVITIVAVGCQTPMTPLQPTATPAPTASQTPSPTPTIVPTPTQVGGGSGKFIFELRRAGFSGAFPALSGNIRVFTANVDGSDLSLVTDAMPGAEYIIEDISPDGAMALISSRPRSAPGSTGDLYLVHLKSGALQPTRLAKGLSTYNGHRAIFVDGDRVIFEGSGTEGKGIYLVNIDGTDSHRIATQSAEMIVIDAANDERVYWAQGEKKTFKDSYGHQYLSGGLLALYWANLDGSAQGKLESVGGQIVPGFLYDYYAYSPDGSMLAWIPAEDEPDCTLRNMIVSQILDGTYTEWAGNPRGAKNWFRSGQGQVIDMPWAEAYVQRCYLLYVAPLADLDNPVKIPLLPPSNIVAGSFSLDTQYTVAWSPDGSAVLRFHGGEPAPILLQVDPQARSPKLKEVMHNLFSGGLAGKMSIIDFSPDGRQILVEQFDGGASFPGVVAIDLATGSRQSSFVRAIAPASNTREQLRPWSIRWLP